MRPMYKEPHLQRKSDQCALIWKNWYNYKYGLKNEKAAARYRKLWCKCVDELSVMLHQAYLDMPHKPPM